MKIVIFGVGRCYQERKHKIPADYEIVAFLDNNPALQGQNMDGRPIIEPEKILQISFDKILLMSASEEAMKGQLIELGVDKKDIWYWERFVSELCRGTLHIYCGNQKEKSCDKRILIVSTHLNYTGGPLAAVYAAKALQGRGYTVFLTAPSGDRIFIDEAIESGISIVLCPTLPYVHKEERLWIQQFDAVLVNVFPMLLCACELSRIKPVLWWIHESEELLYRNIINRYGEYADKKQMEQVHIRAVSKVAQNQFNSCFPDRIQKKLSYGIPDQKKETSSCNGAEHLVFAIIGTLHPGKAQDVFVKAIRLLHREEKDNVHFYIVGAMGIDEYSNGVKKEASKESAIKMTGLLTRREIHRIYEKIDVVVCPSLEDSLPIVATEAMMYGKVCIVSDKTGTADYLEGEKNGLICKAGDPKDLCRKMRWVIENREKLKTMGSEARKVYEKHFTMDNFGKRLEEALKETMEDLKSISVIVPIYYGGKYIPSIIGQVEDCKKCLKEEAYIELLLVNDAPDAPLSPMWKSSEIHVRIINTDKNVGIHGARVKGLRECQGEYLLFLDQDDRIRPTYFYSQLRSIEKNDAVICKGLSGGKEYYSDDEVFKKLLSKEFVLKNWNQIISPGQVLLRKRAIPVTWSENIIKFNGADDWFLWLCMMAEESRFSLNKEVLYEHVVHEENASGDLAGMAQSEHEVIRMVQDKKIFQEKDFQLLMEGFFLRNLFRVQEMNRLTKKLNTLDKWMKLREQGVKYAEYLRSLGIYSAAIYGCGMMGKHLLFDLQPSICVKYFIDKNAGEMKAEVPVYGWKDTWPDADCIIITLVEGEEQVQKDIKEKKGQRTLILKDWIVKTEIP
ncbi:MAG: glycosyltransferase [Lachnospiraceae bacterium]|nr:glycosyltransferase [Lachnospiraceae bacterium]